MTKIDIYSGFLGAGKTTLIKKLLREMYAGQKIVLIENEFGEIGIDGGFLQEAGIAVTEMNSGCICCSLVGDFGKALEKVMAQYAPDRIVIEPSGVGKLSDVIAAVERVDGTEVNYKVAVADASKVRTYMRNFGEFYNNQIAAASAIILSRTQNISEEKLHEAVALLREHNPHCALVTTPWEQLSGAQLQQALAGEDTVEKTLEELREHHCCGHHHEEEHHCCGHHHEEEHHCCGHHHEEEHHCCGHHHEEEHHHGEHCACGHDHHHHHAEEAFTAWGTETTRKYTPGEIESAFIHFDHFGTVLRAKGIVAGENGTWLHFDYVPGEYSVREGTAAVIGKICVIGTKLDEPILKMLFGV